MHLIYLKNNAMIYLIAKQESSEIYQKKKSKLFQQDIVQK